ncbi:hypothetical protein LSUE1_G006849 [Lachnellula suecica]|uniref:Uncharacterized protein n=1 Tax=Lachnellula suecica TaxID=602035 RepID=A0A8T9C9K5_9HELO|nr:hypothetical protein LSUE1_G006849 [Lachnellula suecica]
MACEHDYCQECLQRVVLTSLNDKLIIHLMDAMKHFLTPELLAAFMRKESSSAPPTVLIGRIGLAPRSCILPTSKATKENAQFALCTFVKAHHILETAQKILVFNEY